jgi:hypothetical protein
MFKTVLKCEEISITFSFFSFCFLKNEILNKRIKLVRTGLINLDCLDKQNFSTLSETINKSILYFKISDSHNKNVNKGLINPNFLYRGHMINKALEYPL